MSNTTIKKCYNISIMILKTIPIVAKPQPHLSQFLYYS